MKTKEFIKRVEDLGYETIENKEVIEIQNAISIICYIEKRAFLKFDTTWNEYRELSNSDKRALLDLVYEYARTPVEDREDPKLYYARHKFIGMGHSSRYLNCAKKRDYFYIISDKFETNLYTTQFTQKQLEDLGIWNSNEWIIEEVEDEN